MDFITQIFITILVGVGTGFIGAIVGAGGTISIPFLIFLGIPPSSAIATERFASLGLNISTIRNFIKNKKIIWKYFIPLTLIALITTIINTLFLITIPDQILEIIIILLMVVALFIILKFPKVGLKEKNVSKKSRNLGYLIFGISNFFSAFIGGLGFLKYIIISYFFGTTYIKANASQRLPWAISVLITTIFLLIKGFVEIPLGIALFVGYLIGGHIGAITQINKGNKWVRGIFITIIIIFLVNYSFF